MGDGDKLIDDFSRAVSTTIRYYVKDEKALQKIADVLDIMGDKAYQDGYEEGYDVGVDVAHVNEMEDFDDGYDEGQRDVLSALKNIVCKMIEENDDGILVGTDAGEDDK